MLQDARALRPEAICPAWLHHETERGSFDARELPLITDLFLSDADEVLPLEIRYRMGSMSGSPKTKRSEGNSQ